MSIHFFDVNSRFIGILIISFFLLSLHFPFHEQLVINSLGDLESMERFQKGLAEFLETKREFLSEQSLERIERGDLLRVLDSKDPQDRAVIAGEVGGETAPRLADAWNTESRERFEEVCATLDELGVKFEIDPFLVRGLTYYRHTCFEFLETTAEGMKGKTHTEPNTQNFMDPW